MQSTRNHEAEQQPTRPGSITVSQLNDRGEKIRQKGHVTETRRESRYHEGKQEAIYSFSGAESHREVCITSCVMSAIAVFNYTDVMTTVVLIQTMLLWLEQMTLHVKQASGDGWGSQGPQQGPL